jgi:uncharacterized metal-binding protein
MPFSGTIGRVIYSILCAIVVYIVLLVLVFILNEVALPTLASLIERFALVIALLAGLGYFFAGHRSV